MIAKVIVNIPSSNIDQLFDYLIPPEFCDFASVGSMGNEFLLVMLIVKLWDLL